MFYAVAGMFDGLSGLRVYRGIGVGMQQEDKKGDIENGHLVHTLFTLTQVPENLVRILEFGPPATFHAAQFRKRFSQRCVL